MAVPLRGTMAAPLDVDMRFPWVLVLETRYVKEKLPLAVPPDCGAKVTVELTA